ncbi:hypothetical protein CHS0354_013256 [Potamilus streckersoni]|uniref:Uncharacterized protein n=1 Tax=Potamilus streckersoni TaxID=2493646 RepID=A0AAE0VYC0_9BIVA|nr:hypothetical protein CHS0354_013256 [Potamilus streckersoni]
MLKKNSVSHASNNQQHYRNQLRADNTDEKGGRICCRCGQIGHIASAYRVRQDHSKRDLNFTSPMTGGKQSDTDVGSTAAGRHHINLIDETSFRKDTVGYQLHLQ